jgi:putative ABC transport system substrate-binding protein
LNPDVIFAGSTAALGPLQQVTKTIPIVFAQVSDPVGSGFVTSLARPDGNITGFALYDQAIGVKWLELVKQIAPHIVDVAVVYDPATPSSRGYLAAIEAGAPSIGVQLTLVAVRDAAEIERAIDAFAGKPNGGLIVPPGPIVTANRELIIALANRHRLPAVYPYRFFAASGGLASYGVDYIDTYRRAASYVDRILKGEKPADLPVQEVDKFELVINLKTAKALGLEIPVSVLARTDEVIE